MVRMALQKQILSHPLRWVGCHFVTLKKLFLINLYIFFFCQLCIFFSWKDTAFNNLYWDVQRVFACTPFFAQYCIPLLLEKLSSSLQGAKVCFICFCFDLCSVVEGSLLQTLELFFKASIRNLNFFFPVSLSLFGTGGLLELLGLLRSTLWS